MTKPTIFYVFSLLLIVSACATTRDAQPQWSAFGYLSPTPDDDPEVIGLYATKRECEAAAQEWMTRQVVGNPISSECLPIDRD